MVVIPYKALGAVIFYYYHITPLIISYFIISINIARNTEMLRTSISLLFRQLLPNLHVTFIILIEKYYATVYLTLSTLT